MKRLRKRIKQPTTVARRIFSGASQRRGVGTMPKCSATKANGTPCERLIDAAAIYCYSHDAERADQRSRNASKAAKSKGSTELAEIKAQLRRIADDVLAGDLEKGRGSIAAQVLGVFVRVVEVERRVKETDELEERLAALEQAPASGRRGPWGA
jgi:flagellar motility protein MotE (MotC chaperone)